MFIKNIRVYQTIGVFILAFIVIFGLLYLRNLSYLSRDLFWDESVYLSNSISDLANMYWHPSRSKGILWFLWPLNIISSDFSTVRLYFLIINSLLLSIVWFQLYKMWGLLASTISLSIALSFWQIQVFSANLYPNSLTMTISLLCIISFIRYHYSRTLLSLIVFILLSVVLFELRYAEAICIVFSIALVMSILHFSKNMIIKNLIIFSVTGLLSITPFIIQSLHEYSGVMNRIEVVMTKRNAKKKNKSPERLEHFRLLDGPMSAFDPDKKISTLGLIWLIGLLIFGLCSAVCFDLPYFKEFYLIGIVSIAFILSLYVGWVSAVSMRYFLLVYLMLAILNGVLISFLLKNSSTSFNILGICIILFYSVLSFTFHNKTFNDFQDNYYTSLYQDVDKILSVLNIDRKKYKIYSRYNTPTCSVATNILCYKDTLKDTEILCKIPKKDKRKRIAIYRSSLKFPCIENYNIYSVTNKVNLLIEN